MLPIFRLTFIALLLAGLAACSQPTQTVAKPDVPLYPNETPELRVLINKYAALYDVPAPLVHRVVIRESTHNPAARNGPYYGLMQILPATARGMGYSGPASGLLDAETNLKYGVKYLRGANLYAFWGKRITNLLNETMAAQKEPVLVNLASDEYFKSIDKKALAAEVIQPVFEEPRPGNDKPWAVISFMAKKARGSMTRYVIEKRLTRVESLKEFDRDGYRYAPDASTDKRWVFRRVE